MPLFSVSQERVSPGYLIPHAVVTKCLEAGDAKLADKAFRRGRHLPASDWTLVKNLATHEVKVFE